MHHRKFQFPVIDDSCFTDYNDKVCVVAVIGKSGNENRACKAIPLDEILKKSIFKEKIYSDIKLNEETLCNISGYHDIENNVIYLHLNGIYDSSSLGQVCEIFQQDLEQKGFFHAWSDMNVSYVQAMLFIFLISHIVIIVHPTTSIDVTYLNIFKVLDTVRQKTQQAIFETLKTVPEISDDWAEAGRPCSPRVLYVFMSNPLNMHDSSDSTEQTSQRNKRLPSLTKLQHSLEDKIYGILRKYRIITNVSNNCLFAFPANQEFVHIYQSNDVICDPKTFFINQLKIFCEQSKNENFEKMNSESDMPSFHTFLKQHIDLALSKGFDDNVGRNCMPAHFQLPSSKLWIDIASALYHKIFSQSVKSEEGLFQPYLRSGLDLDMKFSEGRCSKAKSIAYAAYKENLPALYTSDYHKGKLNRALKVFTKCARGPSYDTYSGILQQECENIWKDGHQLCEAISLTGKNCSFQLHRVIESETETSLPVMDHSSCYQITSTCNCGRSQAKRDDPFDIKSANYDFYKKLSLKCCYEFEQIPFPVFEPNCPNSKEANIAKVVEPNEDNDAEKKSIILSFGEPMSDRLDENSISSETAEIVDKLSSGVDAGAKTSFGDEVSKSFDNESPNNNSEINRGSNNNDDCEKLLLALQLSTTEYLPGMLHNLSPHGLLPRNSSWSLIFIGPSSLYSHNLGIHDQPSFVTGTNFLLPWDVSVKISNVDKEIRWGEQRRSLSRNKGKNFKDSSEVTVKIFLGMEYECSRGHRFMCSAPEKVLKASGSGLIKETAKKILSSDMPLYWTCPCRSCGPSIAQLMRIHVVTPKTPVHVMLHPRVQPGPGICPIFYPRYPADVTLTPSAYWILRLPFAYHNDESAILPPKEVQPGIMYGHLLKGACWVVESTDIK